MEKDTDDTVSQGIPGSPEASDAPKILNLYKKAGETPLERIDRARKEYPELADAKMSYAGRLDPMAEGVLLVLVGDDENRNREKYLMLEKEYLFDVLCGFETDTYDVLGKLQKVTPDVPIVAEDVKTHIAQMSGKVMQQYPPFSSRTVKGKPLFEWAREGRLDEITIPTNQVELYKIEFIEMYSLSRADLNKKIADAISLVKGDFRQPEILKLWNEALTNHTQNTFPVFRIRVSCSSGTYVRSLVHRLGEALGAGAIALRIIREKVGMYAIADSLKY